jgi:hypothetical protein
MGRRVAVGRTDVSEEGISSIIRVKRINALETSLTIAGNCNTLGKNNNYMRKGATERDTREMSGRSEFELFIGHLSRCMT